MINKQSNVYTIVYITVMVIVVGAALALTSMSLKDRQNENAQADKKSQILQAVHIPTTRGTVIDDFDKYIVKQLVVNAEGNEVNNVVAFDVDVAAEAKKNIEDRLLPVYVCEIPDAGTKYILPLAGMGLWGPIWGYVAFDSDGSTIYGAFFDHSGETPGLGAEITKPDFTDQFPGKQVFKGSEFYPIEVVKNGQKPMNPNVDYVNGISGGTITSKGVGAMFDNCLQPYKAWLAKLSSKSSATRQTGVTGADGTIAPSAHRFSGNQISRPVGNINVKATIEEATQTAAAEEAKADKQISDEVNEAFEQVASKKASSNQFAKKAKKN